MKARLPPDDLHGDRAAFGSIAFRAMEDDADAQQSARHERLECPTSSLAYGGHETASARLSRSYCDSMHCVILHTPAFGAGVRTEILVIDVHAALASIPSGVRLMVVGIVLAAMRARIPASAGFGVRWQEEYFEECSFDAAEGAIQMTHGNGDALAVLPFASLRAAADDAGRLVESAFRSLTTKVEMMLGTFADPEAARRRLAAVLLREESVRGAARIRSRGPPGARRQRGTCAVCGEPFNHVRKLAKRSDGVAGPLICTSCKAWAAMRR